MTTGQQTGRIVVGVDGSPSSKAALAWAVRQAECTAGTVEAVIAWHYPVVLATPFGPAGVLPETDFADVAAHVLSQAVSAAVEPSSSVKVSNIVTEGNAAEVLLDAAQGADLLVVGSRGHGGFTEALLGSVSQHCVHHAQCPIVIIRAGCRGAAQTREGEVR
jgi:nucleotide-binding universal stress UspA family protein